MLKARILALALGVSGVLAHGQGTITDGTVQFRRGTFGSSPKADLTVLGANGTDHLLESGWWLRPVLPLSSAETPLGTPSQEEYSGGTSVLTWTGLVNGMYTAREVTVVRDASAGVGGAGYAQSTLTISNTSGSPLTINVFHYADFDLQGAANDSAQLLFRNNHMRIEEGPVSAEYRGVGAKAFEASAYPILKTSLNDGQVTNLTNAGLPLFGDVTGGTQWTATIPAQASRSFTIIMALGLSLVRGDFNDDSQSDLLLRNSDYTQYALWTMNGMNRIASVPVTPGVANLNLRAECTEDFDGDLKTDILFRDVTTNELQFWIMGGPLGADQQSVVPCADPAIGVGLGCTPAPEWVVAACGDVDRDGHADILWRNTATQELVVSLMHDNVVVGAVQPDPSLAVHANWSVTALLDYDGDGNTDMLWYNATSGKVVQWFMDGSFVRTQGLFTSPTSAGNNNWKVVASGDYGQGNTGNSPAGAGDILFRNDNSGRIVGWMLDGVIAGSPTGNTRTDGLFTCPTAVGASCDPADPVPAPGALSWFVVGPR